MKEKRDLKIGIKSDKEFFGELKELAGRIDDGWLPEKSVERLYFDDLPLLLKHLTPKRFELLAELVAEARIAYTDEAIRREAVELAEDFVETDNEALNAAEGRKPGDPWSEERWWK